MYHFAHAREPSPYENDRSSPPSARWSALKPAYWDEATRALGQRDRVLRKLIRAHPDIHLRRRHDPFTTLARAIVGQQISVKAADSIWRRFVATVSARRSIDRVRRASIRSGVAAADVAPLRECGLSGRKVDYLRDLASHFDSGALDPKVVAPDGRRRADRGAGRGQGHRPVDRRDVPDLPRASRRRAAGRRHRPAARDCLHYHDGARPTPSAMRDLALAWRPYRSVATWYLWRSLDPIPVQY